MSTTEVRDFAGETQHHSTLAFETLEPTPPTPARPSKWKPTLVLLASFTLTFTVCGINFAFGVYQSLYDTLSHQPSTPFTHASPAQIDLIGTISISLMTLGAPLATTWTKSYSPRSVVILGAVLYASGGLLASVSQELWQFELTQGVLLGIGTCLAYMPSVTVAPTWFGARRGLAMGFVLSGTGVGGVVWAPALQALNTKVGFRNGLRVSSAVAFALIVCAASVLEWDPETERRLEAERGAVEDGVRGRTGSRRQGQYRYLDLLGHFSLPRPNWHIIKSRLYVAQALGAGFQAAAYYTPVFFFASYARSLGYTAATGANFIALSNAANAVGKIVIGDVADRLGRLNALFLTTVISAVCVLGLWVPSTSSSSIAPSDASSVKQTSGKALFIAFAILYGTFASAYVSLFPTSIVELFGAAQFASVNGSLYMVRGIATLIGTPLAGFLVRNSMETASPKTYRNTAVMAGVLWAGAAIAVGWVRFEAAFGRRGKWIWKM